MITLLSKILSFVNGTLFDDHHYQYCIFIIENYIEIEYLSINDIIKITGLTQNQIEETCNLFGFNSYNEFKNYLLQTHAMRLDQIRARMLDDSNQLLLSKMDISLAYDQKEAIIATLCKEIFNAKRIVLFGAPYPLSIAVEMQTDFISLGIPCIQCNDFTKPREGDLAFVISSTGRFIQDFNKKNIDITVVPSILITQNKVFEDHSLNKSKYTIVVQGKFDGINFNYQLLNFFDTLRTQYYKQYYY